MRRAILGLLVIVAVLGIWNAQVAASGVKALRMSLVPEGPAMTDFPSGVERVYVVFEYTDFVSERVRVVVTDYAGNVLFDNLETYTGSGVASIAVQMASGPIPDGPYVTTVYFAGDYLSWAVEWTVGGVQSPPTPTPFPPARLEVEPTTLVFRVGQGEEDPPGQRVLITNHTAPASIWHAEADTSWLRLDRRMGETPALLEVGVRAGGLPASLYTGHVSISAPGVAGSPQIVTITLEVILPQGAVTQDLGADSTGTGWLAADDPEPHLGADEIRVGVQDGRAHLGALRFDASAIPEGSDVQAAAVALTGLGWEIEGPADGWTLELLDPALADDWPSLNYATLATAPTVATLSPVLATEDLAPGVTYFWVFDEAGLQALESALAESGQALFRLAGPDAGEDTLFVWNAAGVLRINFVPPVPPEGTPAPEPGTVVGRGSGTKTPVGFRTLIR
jgi:hypothetical protein